MTQESTVATERGSIRLTPRHFRRLAWHCRPGSGGSPDNGDALDSDLLVAGYLAWFTRGPFASRGLMEVTQAGRMALAARTVEIRAARQPHEDVIGSFIDQIVAPPEIAFRGVELELEAATAGDPYPLRYDGTPMLAARPDILWLSGRLDPAAWRPSVVEVKVQRSDFLRDVGAGKYRVYEPLAERRYFATPVGLVDRSEIPEGWGLYECAGGSWRLTKRARANRTWRLSLRQLMKLVVHAKAPA